jgi:hypothetical protein
MNQHVRNLAYTIALATVTAGCAGNSPTQPTRVGSPAVDTPANVSGSAATSAPLAQVTPNNSEQVVFSGVAAIGSTFPSGSPAGFWIWCEAESNNKYALECKGAMYFYALGITKHVSDNEDVVAVEEFGDEQYRLKVTSEDGSVDCTLESLAEPVHGPHNPVHVSCTSPAGSADSTTAVVNVTGPGD